MVKLFNLMSEYIKLSLALTRTASSLKVAIVRLLIV